MNQFLDLIKTNQTCAWPVELSVNALNVGLPDKNLVYFILPYVLSPGQSFIVKGAFPLDRFTSINTYDRRLTGGTGLDLLGWLPDYAIAPDAGSANPATDPNASPDPAHRPWTVRITGSASPSVTPTAATPVAGQNVLPAMPTGVENVVGVLIMRIYVPTDANDPTGGVGLPSITLEEASGPSRALTECTAADREVWKSFFTPFATQIIEEAPQLPTPPSVDAQPQWLQTTFPGLGTNPDNRYLMVPIAWKPGRVVVVRGKAPTFPNTRAGDPVTKPAQLRYWSFCTGSNVPPLITADCASDFETAIAADGTYTLVVSQPGDKPANATADKGVTWLKGGDPNQPDILFERHLAALAGFLPAVGLECAGGRAGRGGVGDGALLPADRLLRQNHV